MANPDLNAVLAKNLRYFMKQRDISANALAESAKMSPNTVRYYLDEGKRPAVGVKKGRGFPTLDKLAMLADKLGCELWELLHPDIERSLSERDMYREVEAAHLRRIQEKAKEAADAKPVSRLRTPTK